MQHSAHHQIWKPHERHPLLLAPGRRSSAKDIPSVQTSVFSRDREHERTRLAVDIPAIRVAGYRVVAGVTDIGHVECCVPAIAELISDAQIDNGIVLLRKVERNDLRITRESVFQWIGANFTACKSRAF